LSPQRDLPTPLRAATKASEREIGGFSLFKSLVNRIVMHKESNPTTVAAPDGHFSQATVVPSNQHLLFVSGQVPRNVHGDTVGKGNMTVQAEQVFSNIKNVLSAHGADFSNVIKATLYVSRMDLANEVTQVRSQYYGANKPASTFVGVTELGDPDWWLEVEVIAVINQV
jgi:2-iminobutanoate/2-iminopropanoate deaminase